VVISHPLSAYPWHPPCSIHAHIITARFDEVPRLCHLILISLSLNPLLGILSCSFMPHIHLTILNSAHWSATSFPFLRARSHFQVTYYFAHNCCRIALSLSMIYPYWEAMAPTAWIYSIQFEFCSPQLHQNLHPHSECHLNNKTYPLTPDLHWHQYLLPIYPGLGQAPNMLACIPSGLVNKSKYHGR